MIKIPKIVGILNLSPDSFSEDSKNNNFEDYIYKWQEAGVDVIDIGAESTAPGVLSISQKTEEQRLKKIFSFLKNKNFFTKFSIDTKNAKTAINAIKNGCTMVNDVSGGRNDPEMFKVIAKHNVQYVLMYCKNSSGHADLKKNQGNVLEKIFKFFDRQIDQAKKVGIVKEKIILDPGMGAFISPNWRDSVLVLKNITAIKKRYNLPIFIGTSRKGFLSKLVKKDFGPQKRLGASLSTALLAAKYDVDYIRVHDVIETKHFFEVGHKLSVT